MRPAIFRTRTTGLPRSRNSVWSCAPAIANGNCLKKIDGALTRIDDGSYGYCEETGEEIGLKRLEARPVATLSVEAQERRELAERQFRDREDGL